MPETTAKKHEVDGLTPTERRIYAVLGDRLPHSAEELRGCLEDDLAGPTALRFHLCNLRDKLERYGQTVASIRIGDDAKYQIMG